MYLQDYFSGKDEAHHLMAQARDCFLPHFKGNEWTPAGFDAVTKEPTQWSIQLTQPAGRKHPKYMVHLEDAKIVVREIEATGETGKRLMISVKLADEGEERIIRYCSQATAENGLKPSDDLGIGWFISHSLIQGRWPESNPANMLKAFSFRKQYSAVLSERVFRNHIVQTLPDVIDPDLACDMQEFIDRDLSDVLSDDFRRDYEAYEHLNYLTDDDQPDWEQKYLVYIPDEFECQLLTAIALHLEAWLSVLLASLHGLDFDGELLTKMHYEYILGVDCVAKLMNAELPKEVAAEIKEANQLTADAGYWQQRAEAAEAQLNIEQGIIEDLQKEIDRLSQSKETIERSYGLEIQARKDINGEASYLRNLADDALQSLSRVSVDAKQLQVVMLWSAGEINTRRACLTLGMTEKELGRLKANLITSALGNVFHPMRPIYNWSHPEIPAEATHLTGELNRRGRIETVWAWMAGNDGLSFRSGQWVGGIKLQVIHAYGNSILTDDSYQFDFIGGLPVETLEARPGN